MERLQEFGWRHGHAKLLDQPDRKFVRTDSPGLERANGLGAQPPPPQFVGAADPRRPLQHFLDAGKLDQHAAEVEEDRVDTGILHHVTAKRA